MRICVKRVLKRVFNSKNRFTIPDQLFNLIKFETTSYISVNKQINPFRKKITRLFKFNNGTLFILLFSIIIFSVFYRLIIDLLKLTTIPTHLDINKIVRTFKL